MNLKRAIGGFLLSLACLLFFAYIIAGIQGVFANPIPIQLTLGDASDGVQDAVVAYAVKDNVPSPAPEINASAAISVEGNLSGTNKTLFEKNSNVKLPIASLTKLMTAVIVLDNYNLSDKITVSKVADSQEPMILDVKLGDTMSVEDFFDIMLVESSNKSAYALSEGPGGQPGEQKFVEMMNQKAKDLGLENTVFTDPTGLNPEDVSTASDLAKLAEYILKNYPKIADVSRLKSLYISNFGTIANTDDLLSEVPDVICSKTGFTDEAKGCLLLVLNNAKNNDHIINVLLGSADRFAEMKKIINWSSQICN